MAGIGRLTVSNVEAVGDVTQTRQYKIIAVFDIAFDYGGFNAGGASYSITCDGQTQSGTATFNIANGSGSYVWGNIATKTFTVTLAASEGTKTVSISATINTGVNPATITASGSHTLTNKYAVTFNPNGGVLPNPGGNLYNGTNNNSVTVTYATTSYWAMGGDIPTRTGYTFAGWYSAASNGTQVYDASGQAVSGTSYWDSDHKWIYKENVTLYAQWTANTYTNTIIHWLNDFKNSEGNNSSKDAFKLGETTFSATYNSSFEMGSSRKTTVPNGCELKNSFGSTSISGSWKTYSIGTSVTQTASAMSFEYYYNPVSYNITYNLNGGTNSSSNPSSYNVLYGVTLSNPTKTGHSFNGWYNGNSKVTGINQGCNAAFSSSSDLYSKLSSRTTGNITLTAQWTANTYTITYNANGGTNAPSSQTKTYGVNLTLTKSIPTRVGYTFVCWNTKSDGSGANYTSGATFTTNSATTLYAIWEPANVGYLKVSGSYSLCNIYINISGTWKPAIVYKKINGVWGRSVVK